MLRARSAQGHASLTQYGDEEFPVVGQLPLISTGIGNRAISCLLATGQIVHSCAYRVVYAVQWTYGHRRLIHPDPVPISFIIVGLVAMLPASLPFPLITARALRPCKAQAHYMTILPLGEGLALRDTMRAPRSSCGRSLTNILRSYC